MNISAATRESLYVKRTALYDLSSYQLHHDDADVGIQVWIRQTSSENFLVLAFSGRRIKADAYMTYRTESSALSFIDSWIKRNGDLHQIKMQNLKEMSLGHNLMVGDVLIASWGYEQTNIDYFQITKLVGKRSVELREIAKEMLDTKQMMRGFCVPLVDKFISDFKICRVNLHDSVKVHSFGVYAKKKNFKIMSGVKVYEPDEYTSYA